jgi:hypothetical protein
MTDSEIQGVRMVRGAISRGLGQDIHAVLEYYRSVQRELRGAGTAELPGSVLASLGPRASHVLT